MIISVGYKFALPEEAWQTIIAAIGAVRPRLAASYGDDVRHSNTIYAGCFYFEGAKGGHDPKTLVSQAELSSWFKKNDARVAAGTFPPAYLKAVYTSNFGSKHIIIGHILHDGKPFFAVLYHDPTMTVKTCQQKKMAIGLEYGLPIEIENCSFPVSVYQDIGKPSPPRAW